MAKQVINIGSGQNEGDGGDPRLAFEKINSNFDELYDGTIQTLTLIGTSLAISGGNSVTLDNIFFDGLTTDITGSVFADDSSILVDGVSGTIPYPANAGVVWDGNAPTTVDVALDRLASYTQDFAVSTDAHWADPNPADITDAINRLAAAIYALNGNTGI